MSAHQIAALRGKVVIRGHIKALTGLRIGGTAGTEIGGMDNPVIRDPITDRPYIPGSSLKGKMRSLLTRALGKPVRTLVKGRNNAPDIRIHWCEPEEYTQDGRPCVLCRTFGTAGERAQEPVRAIVRDAHLLDELEVKDETGAVQRIPWGAVNTELPYTEVKFEAVIDVITSAANPRQMERVPAGALFGVELLLSVYDKHDRECLRTLLLGMRLLEDDSLGSSGSRGYGRVCFQDLSLIWRPVAFYRDPATAPEQTVAQGTTPEGLLREFDRVARAIWGNGEEGS